MTTRQFGVHTQRDEVRFKPDIVLLDEPMAALDKKLRRQMQIEIMHITRQVGATVVSVTHDQEEAMVMSDRIAIFKSGRLIVVRPGCASERNSSRGRAGEVGRTR